MSEWKIKLPFDEDSDNLLYIESNYDLELVFQKDGVNIFYNCKKADFLKFVINGILEDDSKLLLDADNDEFNYIYLGDKEKIIIKGKGGINIHKECLRLMNRAGLFLL